MLNTVLAERFAMVSAIKYANEEIEKLKLLLNSKELLLEKRKLNSNLFLRLSKISIDLLLNSKTVVPSAATLQSQNTLILLVDLLATLSLFTLENQPESLVISKDLAMI